MSYKTANPLYLLKRWKKKRARILRRDEYLCQEGKRYGRTEQAEVVHHIYPVELYPELAFEDWNLIALSHKSHNQMHKRKSHELTETGLYWQKRVEREFTNFYAPHFEIAENRYRGTEGGDFFQ